MLFLGADEDSDLTCIYFVFKFRKDTRDDIDNHLATSQNMMEKEKCQTINVR
jgi:hypothetical protein